MACIGKGLLKNKHCYCGSKKDKSGQANKKPGTQSPPAASLPEEELMQRLIAPTAGTPDVTA